MGCSSSTEQTNKQLNFEKEVTKYDNKIDKVGQIIKLLKRNLKMNPDEIKKKKLLSQLAHANLLIKNFTRTRQFLIKGKLNMAGFKENIELMKFIKLSNEKFGNTQQMLKQADLENEKYKTNQQNMKELKQITGDTMENADYDQELKKLEQDYK